MNYVFENPFLGFFDYNQSHIFSLFSGLAVLLNHINQPNTTIAVDGSLYRFHPKFKKNMEKAMQMLVNPHIKVIFNLFIINPLISSLIRYFLRNYHTILLNLTEKTLRSFKKKNILLLVSVIISYNTHKKAIDYKSLSI